MRLALRRKPKAFLLGYGKNAESRCGPAPRALDWLTWSEGAVPVSKFYETIHTMIHKTGGSRESYCRVVPEAFAAGVAVVVEDDYAFPELIEDGVTGYRCKTSDEMSYRASELAFDEPKRKRMVEAAHSVLVNEIASDARCWEPWRRFFEGA